MTTIFIAIFEDRLKWGLVLPLTLEAQVPFLNGFSYYLFIVALK